MENVQRPWYALESPEETPSPALLVYPERIRHNIALMLRLAGDAKRLRPHIKTHKTAEIIRMQQQAGIHKFKCATIAEAELLGQCRAKDILLAYQPVGPDQQRLFRLIRAYPESRFSALADAPEPLEALGALAVQNETVLGVFLDLNVGMDRTGISPGEGAMACYRRIAEHPGLQARGLHAYDGHLRQQDFQGRKAESDRAFREVEALRDGLESAGLPVPAIIAGGSPTFPVHALRSGVELSPGTTLLWDARYGSSFPDMDFLPAAVLLSRLVSKPAAGKVCLDLGHKAIAPEMDFPRVQLLGLEDCQQVGQSEEHLVLQCPDTGAWHPGMVVYGIPMHICPTVAKYPRLLVVEDGNITDTWEVAARDYQIHI